MDSTPTTADSAKPEERLTAIEAHLGPIHPVLAENFRLHRSLRVSPKSPKVLSILSDGFSNGSGFRPPNRTGP